MVRLSQLSRHSEAFADGKLLDHLSARLVVANVAALAAPYVAAEPDVFEDLAQAIQAAGECLILRGELEDQSNLNYLRDTVGLMTFLLDQGGIVVYDPQMFHWWEPGEWKEAQVHHFDMAMVRAKPAGKAESRKCTLRVMNTANGLYVALEIPDATFNDSLNPLDLDMAVLAFCKGKELKPGDDRKAIAPGLYSDRHFVAPVKDDAVGPTLGKKAKFTASVTTSLIATTIAETPSVNFG